MAADTQLGGNFWLHEFPGWQLATDADVERLRVSVARVLQPARARFGRLRPTSWMRWSNGELRTGAHAHGGTLDFVALDAPTRDVFEWGAEVLIPSGYIGRWIYEPEVPGVQGEHIHMAPVDAMVEQFGDSRIQVLEEVSPGRYELWFETWGTPGAPIALPGLEVTGAAPGLLGFAATVLFLMGLAREAQPAPTF